MVQNKQTKNKPSRRAGGSKGERHECDVEGAHRAPPVVPLHGFCAFAGMLSHPLLGGKVNQSQKETFVKCRDPRCIYGYVCVCLRALLYLYFYIL